jgi:hypothetical protein
MRLRHFVRRVIVGVRRFLRDTGAMDRRLDAAKHDPAVHMDADIERLRDDGHMNP